MTLRNSFFMIFAIILYTSQAYAMLSFIKPVHCSYATHIRHMSAKIANPRTIEHIYKDIFIIGNHPECSAAYTSPYQCRETGCVRFAFTCAKNIEMQQRALKKRADYLHMIEAQLSHSKKKIANHLKKLRTHFFELCKLEKEAISLMQQSKEIDLELYKRTFTLTAHKMRCLQRQAVIIHNNSLSTYEDSVSTQVVRDIEEKSSIARSYARKEVPDQFRLLCYNAFRWDHPDEIIMYNEPTVKE